MKNFLRNIASFFHLKITGSHPPQGFLSTLASLIVLLAAGTIFYAAEEGWSYLDAFYFSVVTITTVGYGDLHPTTPLSKGFTIFLIFMGVGIGLYVITSFADSFRQGRDKRLERLEALLKRSKGGTELH